MTEIFKPLSDRVLVELEDPPAERNGIVIPPSAQDRQDAPVRGRVAAVGPGRPDNGIWREVRLSINDRVLLDPIGGLALTLNGRRHRLVRQEEILGCVYAAN